MGIGADEGVGIPDVAGAEHALGEVLEVDLVDDADAGGHDLEGVEGLHAPLEELVALAVARELEIEVLLQRVSRAGEINLHGVVDHQIDGHEGLDDLGIFSHFSHGGTHGGEVHEQRHPGEVLQDDTRHHERNFGRAGGIGLPGGQLTHIRLQHAFAVAIAQHGLEDQADADGEARDREAGLFQRGQRVELLAAGKGLQGMVRIGEVAHGEKTERPKDGRAEAGERLGEASSWGMVRDGSGVPQPFSRWFLQPFPSAALTCSKLGRSFGVGVCSAYLMTPSWPMTKAARAAVSPTPANMGKRTS